MKYQIAILILAVTLLLARCGSITEPSEISVIPEPEPVSEPESEPEPVSAIETTPSFPVKPTADQIMDENYWREHNLPLTGHGFQPNFQRGDMVQAYNGSYLYISCWLAANGQLPQYIILEKSLDSTYNAILPLDDYFYYVEKFFGSINAKEDMYKESIFNSIIDWDNRTIKLNIPEEYDLETNTFDAIEFGWFVKHWKFTNILPYTENGVDKVKIEVEDYESEDHLELERLETFVFYWDDDVGYIPESSSWEYPVTNRVSLEGNIEKLDTLFGEKENFIYSCFSIGNRVFNIYREENLLKYNILDLKTGEQRIDLFMQDFKDENIFGWECVNNNIYVRTSKAVYRFDEELQLIDQKQLPKSMTAYDYTTSTAENKYIVNPELTLICFTDDHGIYICRLEETAMPELLQEHPYKPKGGEDKMKGMRLYPITFTPGNRIFAGIAAWESTAGFIHYDTAGGKNNLLDNISTDYGSDLLYDQKGALFLHPGTEDRVSCYYRWADQKIIPAEWLPAGQTALEMSSWISQDIRYFSLTQGDYKTPDKTIFISADFDAGQAVTLPFAVIGAQAKILAAGENGKILFLYGYKGESGFCIYTPE